LPEGQLLNLLDLQKQITMAYNIDIPINDIIDMLLKKKSDKLKNWRLEKLDNGNVLFFKGKNYRDLTKPLNKLLERDERLVWNKK
jgi:hypothetical protein